MNKFYTHDLTGLLAAAELQQKLDADSQADKDFEVNWSVVSQWNEDSRYEAHSKATAEGLIDAIEDSSHGVFQWLQSLW